MEVKEKMIADLKASDAQKSNKIAGLKRELAEAHRRTRRLGEAMQERDHALAQVEVEKMADQHAKDRSDEEYVARVQLQEENVRLKESLAIAQSRIDFCESEGYRSEVVEEYRQSLAGKAEVVLACKAGYDYLEAQLSAEMRDVPSHLHYPPSVSCCLEILEDLEKQGKGIDLGEIETVAEGHAEEDEAPANTMAEVGEGSLGQKDEGAKLKSHLTSPHSTSSALPLPPGADVDSSSP